MDESGDTRRQLVSERVAVIKMIFQRRSGLAMEVFCCLAPRCSRHSQELEAKFIGSAFSGTAWKHPHFRAA